MDGRRDKINNSYLLKTKESSGKSRQTKGAVIYCIYSHKIQGQEGPFYNSGSLDKMKVAVFGQTKSKCFVVSDSLYLCYGRISRGGPKVSI
jgi:hypothetical protein